MSLRIAALALFACALAQAAPTTLDTLSSKDATSGLRAALSQGIDVAVTQLGAPNGFLKDPKVTIPLPPALAKAEKGLRLMGMGAQADDLKVTMNRAAEAAVVEAKPIFKSALQKMTLADAKMILAGADDAATQYFRGTVGSQLADKFKPIVARETAKLQLSAKYDQYAGQAAGLGLIKPQEANLNDYVTAKALDGLFGRIAEQERAIRKDPIGQSSSIIKKVFGALDN